MKRLKSLALLVVLVLAFSLFTSCVKEESVVLHITLPKSENVQNINTNYYKLWLEEQTGYTLVFNEVPGAYEESYIADTLLDENIKTDIVLFGWQDGQNALLSSEEARQLAQHFLQLDNYITPGTHMHEVLEEYESYGWREFLSGPDGKLYFVPGANPSRSAGNGQSFWINTAWLNNLGLAIPKTTEELEAVLLAFQTEDPNQNGITDEIPLAGSYEHYDTMSHNAILNAFVYYDPASYGFYMQEDTLRFSPQEDEFREGLFYLQSLYEKGLLHPLQFKLDSRGLTALATDPENILGAFSASHLSDVFTESDSNRFSHFTHLAPLNGAHTVPQLAVPWPAAAISSFTEYPNEAFALLDLMFSEEAFLISLYGEEGIDWDHALPTDVDIFGEVAEIATMHHLGGTIQNKNFDGIGSMFYYPQYVDGVRYSDYDIGYFNARALLSNESHFRPSGIGLSILTLMQRDRSLAQQFSALDAYTQQNLEAFISGEKDIADDAVFREFMDGYTQFDTLFSAVEREVLG